jgi:hypothetical protein
VCQIVKNTSENYAYCSGAGIDPYTIFITEQFAFEKLILAHLVTKFPSIKCSLLCLQEKASNHHHVPHKFNA